MTSWAFIEKTSEIRRIAYLHLLGEFIDILMHDLSVTKYAVTK